MVRLWGMFGIGTFSTRLNFTLNLSMVYQQFELMALFLASLSKSTTTPPTKPEDRGTRNSEEAELAAAATLVSEATGASS